MGITFKDNKINQDKYHQIGVTFNDDFCISGVVKKTLVYSDNS